MSDNVYYVTVRKVEELTYRVTGDDAKDEVEAQAFIETADIETLDDRFTYSETVSTDVTRAELVDERPTVEGS